MLSWGLLEALQHDRDAIVAVLAHEYAHHGKEHISKTKSTEGVLGIQGAIAAGYNPMGAVRLQKKLLELAGSDNSFSLFRSQPPFKERASELEALIAKSEQAKPLLGQPLVALNLPQDNDEDEGETTTAPNAADRMALAAPAPPRCHLYWVSAWSVTPPT